MLMLARSELKYNRFQIRCLMMIKGGKDQLSHQAIGNQCLMDAPLATNASQGNSPLKSLYKGDSGRPKKLDTPLPFSAKASPKWFYKIL